MNPTNHPVVLWPLPLLANTVGPDSWVMVLSEVLERWRFVSRRYWQQGSLWQARTQRPPKKADVRPRGKTRPIRSGKEMPNGQWGVEYFLNEERLLLFTYEECGQTGNDRRFLDVTSGFDPSARFLAQTCGFNDDCPAANLLKKPEFSKLKYYFSLLLPPMPFPTPFERCLPSYPHHTPL